MAGTSQAMTKNCCWRANTIGSSMNLHRLLNARRAAGKPVRVALIGAGKFGSMFLSQVPHTPGLEVPVIVDLDPQRAREACRTVGWDAERIAATTFTGDAAKATSGDIEVIVEATGWQAYRDGQCRGRRARGAAACRGGAQGGRGLFACLR
jgi:FlaA1/EpsC-like NDP-sugar epimerase